MQIGGMCPVFLSSSPVNAYLNAILKSKYLNGQKGYVCFSLVAGCLPLL